MNSASFSLLQMELIFGDRAAELFPELQIELFLVTHGLQYSSDDECRDRQRQVTEAVRARYSDSRQLESHYLAQCYEDFYRRMQLNPRKVSTPLRQAARFLTKDYTGRLRIIDSCMEIEYTTGVSFQCYDAEQIGCWLRVDVGQSPMPMIDFHGKAESSRVGELVTVGERGLLHAPSVGNSSRFAVKPESHAVLVRVLGVPGLHPIDWRSATDRATAVLKPICRAAISAQSPHAILA